MRKKEVIDLAVIIALKEEFEDVHSAFGLTQSTKFDKELGEWYQWVTSTINGEKIKGYFSFIGHMGPAYAINFTTRFLEYYAPKVLLNFGLSGSLDDDVKLGDVVVADLVDLYDDAGAIKDVGKDAFPEFSGASFRCEAFKEHTDNFPFKHRDKYLFWQDKSSNMREHHIDTINYDVLSQLLGEKSNSHTGHVACGSLVVANEMWRKGIKKRDRKYLAIDMESAGITLSAYNKDVSKDTNILIVRAISDPADERKKILDSLGDVKTGAIRKWALMNGINFLKEFIPTIPMFLSQLNTDTAVDSQFDVNQLVPEVILAYKEMGPTILNKYELFFRFFIGDQTEWRGFSDLLDRIENLPQSHDGLASVMGYAGTGKSALLSCIFLRQLERFNKNETKYIPVYINLRMNFHSNDDIEASAAKFEQYFIQATSTDLVREANNILLIIDGCDEYFRDSLQSKIDQTLPKLIEVMSRTGKVLKVVGVGNNEDKEFLKERRAIPLTWATSREVLVTLNRVDSNHPCLSEIIAAYLKILSNDNHVSSSIENAIRSFGITEIDLYTLSMIHNAICRQWKIEHTGLGPLYYRTCIEKIRQISHSHSLTNDQARKILQGLAEEIFKIYVKREFEGSCNSSKYQRYHFIAHQHPTIKEFLIAEYVVEKVTLGEISVGLFECIYPFGINRFVKSNLNRTVDVQSKALKGIKKNFGEQDFGQKAHLAYILGRISDRGLKMQSEKLLLSYCKVEEKSPASKKPHSDPEFRAWLMSQRTIYISLIYIGNKNYADNYLERLLSNSYWDDLNRGFHLEYYEDYSKEAGSPLMISFDFIEVSPKKTFEILYSKINKDIRQKKNRTMTSVDLYTLCSLCLNRHVKGRLRENKRVRLIDLIQRALSVGGLINKTKFTAYLYMAIELLARSNISIGDIALDLLNLKNITRIGWNSSREFEGKIITRKCSQPESVADHTFGCLLIAEMFLPEKYPEKGYSKPDILRTLLIHDLGEAFLGDKAKYEKTQADAKNEDKTMMRVSSLMSIKGIHGLKKCGEYWKSFSNLKGINGNIAKDIDLIECYLQLEKYNSNPECRIPDKEAWAHEIYEDLNSQLGKDIFDSLRHEGSDFLGWHQKNMIK